MILFESIPQLNHWPAGGAMRDTSLINCTNGDNYCNSGSPSECHVSYFGTL